MMIMKSLERSVGCQDTVRCQRLLRPWLAHSLISCALAITLARLVRSFLTLATSRLLEWIRMSTQYSIDDTSTMVAPASRRKSHKPDVVL